MTPETPALLEFNTREVLDKAVAEFGREAIFIALLRDAWYVTRPLFRVVDGGAQDRLSAVLHDAQVWFREADRYQKKYAESPV